MEKQLEFHNRNSNGEPGLVVVRWKEHLAGWRISASLNDLVGTELGTDFLTKYHIVGLKVSTTGSGVRSGELKLENHFLDTSGSTTSKTTDPFVSTKLVFLDFSKPGPVPVVKHRRGGMPDKTHHATLSGAAYFAAADPFNIEKVEESRAAFIRGKARRKGHSIIPQPFIRDLRAEQAWREFQEQAEENSWQMAKELEKSDVQLHAELEQKDFEDVIDELRGYYSTIYDHEI